jgi:PIN domain nuclease of toxin-antitoxin system
VIVVDTQAVIWLTEEPKRLSQAARFVLTKERSERNLMIADITLREIAMIVDRGRVKVSTPLEEYLAFIESVFSVMPITARIAGRSQRFTSIYPNDPADRLIGATAIMHDARLVTSDEKIRNSGEVNCIW